MFVTLFALAGRAVACDLWLLHPAAPKLCRLREEATAAGRSWLTGAYGAVAEQFTHFGTVQVDGHEVGNPTDQHLDSSITQLVGGYSFNSRFALQVNVPLIYRSFERPEGFAIDRGTESGLGDVSLLGKLVLFHTTSPGWREVKFDDPEIAPDGRA